LSGFDESLERVRFFYDKIRGLVLLPVYVFAVFACGFLIGKYWYFNYKDLDAKQLSADNILSVLDFGSLWFFYTAVPALLWLIWGYVKDIFEKKPDHWDKTL